MSTHGLRILKMSKKDDDDKIIELDKHRATPTVKDNEEYIEIVRFIVSAAAGISVEDEGVLRSVDFSSLENRIAFAINIYNAAIEDAAQYADIDEIRNLLIPKEPNGEPDNDGGGAA